MCAPIGKSACTTPACATQPKSGGLFSCFKGKGSLCGTNAGCVTQPKSGGLFSCFKGKGSLCGTTSCGTNAGCVTQPKSGGLFSCFKGKGNLCGTTSCGTNAGCTSAASRVCDANPCEIAELIYTSQTACSAWQRRSAVDDLGDYDAVCNPEVMVALIYALNDASAKVRAEAADEIGDLLDDGKACCSPQVVSALTCALGDCDWCVRRQAKEAWKPVDTRWKAAAAPCARCSAETNAERAAAERAAAVPNVEAAPRTRLPPAIRRFNINRRPSPPRARPFRSSRLRLSRLRPNRCPKLSRCPRLSRCPKLSRCPRLNRCQSSSQARRSGCETHAPSQADPGCETRRQVGPAMTSGLCRRLRAKTSAPNTILPASAPAKTAWKNCLVLPTNA